MNRAQKIFLHAFVWIAILIFFVFLSSRNGNLYESVIIFFYFGIFNIGIFYSNYLYILPRYLKTRQYWLCTLYIIFLILLSGILKYGIAYLFDDVILKRDGVTIPFSQYYVGSIFTGIFFVFLSTAFKFAADWFVNEKVKKNLESEKLIAELAFLRSQINPHFLFNSLNNIYSLAYQKSDKAPEAIMKLSEIMRYMLQESNEPRVKLSREIRYLENYIELQKLRFKGQAYIDLVITGDFSEQDIAPLILISFVENAFKHGVAFDKDNPIKINVKVEHNHLLFEIHNMKNKLNKDESSGIGLNNVQRRLDLIYPDNYRLEVQECDDFYYCKLSLNL